MNPGFSERTFEFCFNSEYCQLNAAILATHPHIPSQRMERDLGYDVEFRLTEGDYSRFLFLQHKVAYYAETRSGRNAHFYERHAGPYFRFHVDNDQHNTLRTLAATRGNAFYCAPRFHLSHQLDTQFRGSTIGSNCVMLDPTDVGDITDQENHNITYKPDGTDGTLHSKPQPFKQSFEPNGEKKPRLKKTKITTETFDGMAEELMARTLDSKFKRNVTTALRRMKPIEQTQFLLGRVYQVSWLLLP